MQEFECRIPSVGNYDYAPVRQPAAQLDDHLARPVGDLLVPPSHLLVVALCGSKRSENGQSPGAMRPGNVRQPHQADPAQTARSDQVSLARAHCIPEHPLGADATATSAFQSLVYAEHQRFVILGKMPDQERKQYPAQLQWRPDSAVEYVVVLCEAAVVAESHNTKRGSDCASAWGEYGADEQ